MKYSFQGHTALISGAGSGIGAATATLLAANGLNVVVSDLTLDAAQHTVDVIAQSGGRAVAHAGDVAQPETAQAAVDCALQHFGGLHLAVNNAGIGTTPRAVAEMTPADWQRIIDINLSGVMHALRAQIPVLLQAGGGAIVNVSSILGLVGSAGAPAYVAAKHGVTGLTRSAALAYAARGVRINSVHPGYVKTAILDNLDAQMLAGLVGLHAIGRLGEPDEIAHTIAFLLSEGAGFMAGSALVVDGGYTAA